MRKIYVETENVAMLEVWSQGFVIGFQGDSDTIKQLREILDKVEIRSSSAIIVKEDIKEKKKKEKKTFTCCGRKFSFSGYVNHLKKVHRISWWKEFIESVFPNQEFSKNDLLDALRERDIECSQWAVISNIEKLAKSGEIERVGRGKYRCKLIDSKKEERKMMEDLLA